MSKKLLKHLLFFDSYSLLLNPSYSYVFTTPYHYSVSLLSPYLSTDVSIKMCPSSCILLMTIFGGKIQMIPKNSCHHHRLIIHPDRNGCFLFAFFPGSLLIHAHTCFHQSMKVIVRLFSFLLLHLSSSHLEARRHRELFITYKQNFCLYLVYNTGRDPGLHVH